jgi:predicted RNase H-like nuclease (RuvC/YqgF family)
MADLGPNTTTAATYPPETLYEQWSDQADALDMSISQFMIRMIEAGRKNISMEDASSESIRELLQQKSDLKRELQRKEERIQDLERQLQHTSRSEIVSYIEDNPGARMPEITQKVADTVPGRVASHLDALEGDLIEQRDDGYYLGEGNE